MIPPFHLSEILERISDAFVAFDKHWHCTYLNEKAAVILNHTQEELIGKNVWKEYPEFKETTFHKAFLEAMETQKYFFLEGYYPSLNKWFENHIYPSPDGVSVFIRDITEKKKGEEKIKENEIKFRTVFEHSVDAIGVSKFGIHEFVNSAYLSLFGYLHSDELNGKPILDLIAPSERDKILNYVKLRSKAEFVPPSYETRGLRKDGSEFAMDVHVSGYELNQEIYTLVILRDITERKKTEEKIIKLNRLYHFISQINQMIVRTTDEQTLFSEACKIAVDFGKFKMAWIGLIDEKTKKVIPVMQAGDAQNYLSKIRTISVADEPEGHGPTGTSLRKGKYNICNDIENDLRMAPWKAEALNCGYRSSIALPIKKSEKTIGAFSLYASETNFFDKQEIALLEEVTGNIAYALEVFEKTELHKKAEEKLRESEERLRITLEETQIGSWDWDIRNDTWYASQTYYTMLGYEPINIPDREEWLNRVHPDDRVVPAEKIRNVLNGSKSKYQYEVRILHADGTYRWISVIGHTIEQDEDGKPTRMLGVRMDITERKLAEQEIAQMNEQLRDLSAHLENIREEERKSVAREIHDELGQQLAALKIDAKWLSKKVGNNEDNIQKINEMLLLIDDTVKTVRKISSEIRPEMLDELGLLAALEWKVNKFIEQTSIKCNLQIDAVDMLLPSYVSINIYRIVQESFTNVAKYSKATEINLLLKTENKNLIVTFSDNGKGFDAEKIKQKKTFGIIGMRERAKIIGGELQIRSQEGKGTIVELIVPVG